PPAGPPEGRPVKRELLLAAAAFAFLASMLALAAAALIFLTRAVVDLAHARGLAYAAAALSVIAGGMAVSYGVDRAPWPWARTARTVLDVLFVAAGSLGVVVIAAREGLSGFVVLAGLCMLVVIAIKTVQLRSAPRERAAQRTGPGERSEPGSRAATAKRRASSRRCNFRTDLQTHRGDPVTVIVGPNPFESLAALPDVHIPLTLTALSPISHGAGTSGNTQLLRT